LLCSVAGLRLAMTRFVEIIGAAHDILERKWLRGDEASQKLVKQVNP
jgi:hypothetical protein